MKEQKRKPINPELIILACLAVLVLFFAACSLVRNNLSDGGPGKCISFSIFGKLELLGVDRAVISVYGEEVTIVDTDLIDRIVAETRVATHVDSNCEKDCCGCYEPHFQINLYRGSQLVRSMEWESCCDTIKVYEPDLTHWLIGPPFGEAKDAGYIELSDELAEQLIELIHANK